MIRDGPLRVSDPARRHYLLRISTPQGNREVLVPTNEMAGCSVDAAI